MCLVAILPVVLGGAGGLVLCLGEDGHIAIEVAHGEPCDSHGGRGGEKRPAHANEGAIGALLPSCFDIPITMPGPLGHVYHQSLSRGECGREYIPQPLYALHQSSGAAPQQADARGIGFGPPPPIRRSLIEHRTTVLLI